MKARRPLSTRALVARIVTRVVYEDCLLDRELELARNGLADPRDQGFVQECAYGVLRHYHGLRHRLATLLSKPVKQRDADLEALLLSGLYQLFELQMPAHAVVNASATACRELEREWATGLVNATLRNALRQADGYVPPADTQPEARWQHPQWLIDAVAEAWPAQWRSILAANLARAPLTLRVNLRRRSRDDYLAALTAEGIGAHALAHCPAALVLDTPVPVGHLPGFADGLVSVQDGAAQLAAPLLDVAPGTRVLDACAAPGGKALHLLETVDNLDLTALDVDPTRLARVVDGARRLGLACTTRAVDASQPARWWDGAPYDRVLVDAPCSATGVIRRHPDIKLHRAPEDLPALAARQGAIVDALWPLLRAGGKLLYVTCSILPQENDEVITAALARHPDAVVTPLDVDWGHATRHGRQILPGEHDMDGFYFCLIGKPAHG